MSNLENILAKIERLQSDGSGVFAEGTFAATRSNPILGYAREDSTIFFTAVIVFTLQRLKKHLPPPMQARIDHIADRATKNYPDFENKDGLKTYNFWQTKPTKHFPNGYVFRHFDHFKIPDDTDDTAMVYLTTQPSAAQNHWLKHKLTLHANLSTQKIKNTFAEYQTLRAYSTWFGKKMYIEFDVCVLCNVLYWVFENKLPLNQHDADSLAYVRSVIETDRHRTAPFRVAHQYPRTPVILYHVARLMGAFEVTALEPVRAKLIEDARAELLKASTEMDKIILQTALINLTNRVDGLADGSLPIPTFKQMNDPDFYFFIAGLLTAYQHPTLYKWAANPIFHIRWRCEAFNWTLVFEHQVLMMANDRG